MFKLFCPVNGFENKIFKDFSQFILMLKSEHPSVAPYLPPRDHDLYKIDSIYTT